VIKGYEIGNFLALKGRDCLRDDVASKIPKRVSGNENSLLKNLERGFLWPAFKVLHDQLRIRIANLLWEEGL
jgi:hypothetical protein